MPYEGEWKIQVTADRHGRPVRRCDTRDRPGSSAPRRSRPRSTITAPAVDDPADRDRPLTVAPGGPMTFSGTATDDENLNQRRDPAAQHHHAGEPRRRRHLGHRRAGRLVTGSRRCNLNAHQLQLVVHHAVQPEAGHVHVLGPGHRRPGPETSSDQPGPADDQRAGPGRRPAERRCSTSRARHRRAGRCTSTWPARRPTTSASPGRGRPAGAGHAAATCSPTARCPRRSRRGPRRCGTRTPPAPPGRCRSTCPTQGDWTRHGVRLRHRRPAGHLDDRGDRPLPDLPG